MNIFDRFFLKLFLLAGPLLQKLNVNMDHLQAILVAKLTMDNRRPAAFQQMRASTEKKELNKATLKTMFVSLVMGLLFLFSFALGDDLTLKLTVFFSMFIFMLAATLITDFTSVLIDSRDNLIILPKPVNDATFVTARLIHITIHINKMLIPMALPSLIALIVIRGAATILPFMLMLLLATLFSIFIINAVYILILKITKPSKFQSVISYLQIAFAVVIYGGYQLLPRMMEEAGLENLKISELQNIVYYPPYWFAAACNSLINLTFGESDLYNLALAIAVPLICIFIVVKYFAPPFNQKLSMINSSSEEVRKAVPGSNGTSGFGLSRIEKLAAKITGSSAEYMGFLFTWKMMGRSRDFKMKVYPAFGYVIVLLALMVFRSKTLAVSDLTEMSQQGKSVFLFVVYFSSFILITALGQLSYSEKYKAAWLFSIAPLETPGKVISGAVKSVIVCFYLPIVIFFSIVGLALAGPAILPNLILVCFNILTISSLIAYFTLRDLPFSVSAQNATKGRTFVKSMITMIIPLILGGIHWFIFDYLWAVAILAVLAVIASWMVMDSIRNLTWDKIGRSL
jgi:hypothetical protein